MFWTAAAAPAVAHAVLERSVPAPNATLEAAPRQIVLVLSEPVDPAFSSAEVLTRSERRVSRPATFANDRRTLSVSVDDLPPSAYTVRWRVLSGIDGHITSGAFVFGVGQSPGPGTSAAGAASPDPVRAAVRWVTLLAAILLAGSTFFQPLVLRPGLSALPADTLRPAGAAAGRRLRTLTAITSASLLAGLGAEMVLQAVMLLDAPLSSATAREGLWRFLWGTKPGWSTLLRAAMVLLLVLPLLLPRSSTQGLASVPSFAAAGLLAGFTMTAHASGQGPLAILADWLHLLAVALWIGGLASLLLVLRAVEPSARRPLARVLVPRFSTLAGLGLGVVVLTGLYSAWLHVPALRALTATPYGGSLLVKLLLVVPLIALGAINRFVMRPRLAASTSREGVVQWFLRLVTGEVGLGAAVLLVVAILTITPPAKVTFSAGSQKAPILAGYAGDVRVRLTLEPAQPGRNRYEVVAAGADRRPLNPADRLLLRFVKLEEDLDPTTITLTPADERRYTAEGGELVLPGWWEIEVIVRRGGRLDVSTFFPLRLGAPPGPRSDPFAEELLQDARDRPLRSWREMEQLTDGIGSVVITRYELIPPDRLHYLTRFELQPNQTTGVTEVVIVGADRYERKDSGSWKRETLQRPLVAEGHRVYLRFAEGVFRGRRGRCDDEPCQVVLWTNPGGTPAFAAWIGLKSLRVHRLYMLSPLHYMTLRPVDFDVPLRIVPPRP